MNTDAIKRRIRKSQDHFGQTIEFSGAEYGCLPAGMRDRDFRNRDQTFRDSYETSVYIIADDVTIAKGDTVTYKGSIRRVLDTSDTGDDVQRTLHLGARFGSG